MGLLISIGLMAIAFVVMMALRPDLSRRDWLVGLGVCSLAAAGAFLAALPYLVGR